MAKAFAGVSDSRCLAESGAHAIVDSLSSCFPSFSDSFLVGKNKEGLPQPYAFNSWIIQGCSLGSILSLPRITGIIKVFRLCAPFLFSDKTDAFYSFKTSKINVLELHINSIVHHSRIAKNNTPILITPKAEDSGLRYSFSFNLRKQAHH